MINVHWFQLGVSALGEPFLDDRQHRMPAEYAEACTDRAAVPLLLKAPACPGDGDTVLAELNAALADAIFSVRTADVALLEIEVDPCMMADATLDQRHRALLAKIAASPGGQSIACFTQVAAALGYTITVTEFHPFWLGRMHLGDVMPVRSWIFAWQVNAPMINVHRFQLGASALGEPFLDDRQHRTRMPAEIR